MASLRKRIAKPGELVVTQRGGIVGIVLAVKKDRKFGSRYKLACVGGPFWVFHDQLSAPRLEVFEDLIRLYDSSVGLLDRMAALSDHPGGRETGDHVREVIFELVTAVAIDISKCKTPTRHELNRVMLDFGARAGFDEGHMAEGRALMKVA
jgi:hypothetical protein